MSLSAAEAAGIQRAVDAFAAAIDPNQNPVDSSPNTILTYVAPRCAEAPADARVCFEGGVPISRAMVVCLDRESEVPKGCEEFRFFAIRNRPLRRVAEPSALRVRPNTKAIPSGSRRKQRREANKAIRSQRKPRWRIENAVLAAKPGANLHQRSQEDPTFPRLLGVLD